MAKQSGSRARRPAGTGIAAEPVGGAVPPAKDPGNVSLSGVAPRTGRKLVLLASGGTADAAAVLQNKGGISASKAEADPAEQLAELGLEEGKAALFPSIGVAVCNADPDQALALARVAGRQEVLRVVEDERVVFHAGFDSSWLRGYRDAVNALAARLLEGEEGGPGFEAATVEGSEANWALAATLADRTDMTGKDVQLAVLDTGLDFAHPDFAGRAIGACGFVQGAQGQGNAQDGHGHGTHCVGVAAGPKAPRAAARYGVAGGASLYVGKVLDDLGQGTDGSILAGIEWALQQGCRVISMSLGAPVPSGGLWSEIFELVARRAVERDSVIMAAAGNDSDRPSLVAPVSHPANCPSILAVGAIDARMRVARFSNAKREPRGGRIDVAAPGVGVFSAWSGSRLYRQESGTSMATPHVAGVAAMLLEADRSLTGAQLMQQIRLSVRPLAGLSPDDVGSGLIQAPFR